MFFIVLRSKPVVLSSVEVEPPNNENCPSPAAAVSFGVALFSDEAEVFDVSFTASAEKVLIKLSVNRLNSNS